VGQRIIELRSNGRTLVNAISALLESRVTKSTKTEAKRKAHVEAKGSMKARRGKLAR